MAMRESSCGPINAKALVVNGRVHVLVSNAKHARYFKKEYQGTWMPVIKPWHSIMEKKEKRPEYEPYWNVNGVMKMRKI